MPGSNTIVAKVGEQPSAGIINDHEARLQSIEKMEVTQNGGGRLYTGSPGEKYILDLPNAGGGNLAVWVVVGGELKQASLNGTVTG